MGRPPKFTPEEAKKRRKQSLKNSKQKFNAKVKNDPVLHEKEKSQKRDSQAKRIANMTLEEKEAFNEYRRIKKQESRQRNSPKSKANPSQKDLASIIKPVQLKVSSEQSAEINIQKSALSRNTEKRGSTTLEGIAGT